MGPWPILAPCLAALGLGLYLACDRGLAVAKCIAAAAFVFRRAKDADRVTLVRCTGWVRHGIRLQGHCRYSFALEAQLSEGTAEVLLLDRQKQPLLRLDHRNPTGQIEVDGQTRCYLRWKFTRASGGCTLHWQPESNE